MDFSLHLMVFLLCQQASLHLFRVQKVSPWSQLGRWSVKPDKSVRLPFLPLSDHGKCSQHPIWNCLSTPWATQHLRTFPRNAVERPAKMPSYKNTMPNLNKSSKKWPGNLFLSLIQTCVVPQRRHPRFIKTHLHNLLSFPVRGGGEEVAGSQV